MIDFDLSNLRNDLKAKTNLSSADAAALFRELANKVESEGSDGITDIQAMLVTMMLNQIGPAITPILEFWTEATDGCVRHMVAMMDALHDCPTRRAAAAFIIDLNERVEKMSGKSALPRSV